MSGVEDFERHLLARMRGDRAREELARRGGPVDLDLDEPAQTIARYGALLGRPALRVATPGLEAASPFAGSIAWHWALPTWPATTFVINEHPQGWTWIAGFARPRVAGVSPTTSALVPWDWLRGELAVSMATTVLDAWDQWIDLEAAGNDGRRYRLRFDFELLQDVQPLPTGDAAA